MAKKVIVNEWITIKGRKMLCETFITALDWERMMIPNDIQRRIYCDAIVVLQCCTDEYSQGESSITYSDGFIEEHGVSVPKNKTYPQALEEIYYSIEKITRMDFSDMLDKVAKQSLQEDKRNQIERNKKQTLNNIVNEMLYNKSLPENTAEKISALLELNEHKKANKDYNISKSEERKENRATELWCGILLHGMNSKYIRYCDLKSLVEQEFLDESDISDILEGLGDKRDYEWYTEDLMSFELMEDTIIPNEIILKRAEPAFMQILNIKKFH